MQLVQLLRHLLSILILPTTAVLLMPLWLVNRFGGAWPGDGDMRVMPLRIAGALLLAAGFALFAWCIWLFGRVGEGTLAPWDPPRRFVAVGPYRYTRNPMISGVAAMLIGEALFLISVPLALWALMFIAANQLYFMLSEEPRLERRFGARYRAYKTAVPRWMPRRKPWEER